MNQAEMEAHAIHKKNNSHHPIFAAIVGLCLFLSFITYDIRSTRPGKQNELVQKKVEASAAKAQTDMQMINHTLELVARDLNRKVDVNKDGLINCIDAAVLFYQYYPEKSKVAITWNYHPEVGMNHLFNTVLVDGVWRGIEPQAGYKGLHTIWMKEVWGKKYDINYNTPATEKYKLYVRN